MGRRAVGLLPAHRLKFHSLCLGGAGFFFLLSLASPSFEGGGVLLPPRRRSIFWEALAKERQRQSGEDFGRGGKVPQIVGEPLDKHGGEATEQAAQLFGTNRQYISDAKKMTPYNAL